MPQVLEPAALPLDDGAALGAAYNSILGGSNVQGAPAFPLRNVQTSNMPRNDTSVNTSGLSYQPISPPPQKRPRVEYSVDGSHATSPNVKFKFAKPESFGLNKTRSTLALGPKPISPKRAGSVPARINNSGFASGSPTWRGPPNSYTRPDAGRTYSDATIPRGPRSSTPKFHSTIFSPQAAVHFLPQKRSNWSVTFDHSYNSVSNQAGQKPPSRASAETVPTPASSPPADDRASSSGIRSPSEGSSVGLSRDECTNCRFLLYRSTTLECDRCRRQFHDNCKNSSVMSDNKWKCARCIKKELKKAKDAGIPSTNLTVPQSSRTSPHLSLPSRSRSHSRDPLQLPQDPKKSSTDMAREAPEEAQEPLQIFQKASGPTSYPASQTVVTSKIELHTTPFTTSSSRQLLRDTGVKPGGNAFANGLHLQSTLDKLHMQRHMSRTPPTRPASRGTESEASMDLSDVGDFTDSNIITSTPFFKSTMLVPHSNSQLTPLDTPTSAPDAQPSVSENQVKENLANGDITPRKLPPGVMRIKKKTAADHDQEKITVPTRSKPKGIPGWTQQFELAGIDSPFNEGGARSEKLNYCDEVFRIFNRYPWELVNRALRPRRFNIELLRSLASLDGVLDSFDSPDHCLYELEKYITTRNAKDDTADQVRARLTSGDVRSFIAAMDVQPVQTSGILSADENAPGWDNQAILSLPNNPMMAKDDSNRDKDAPNTMVDSTRSPSSLNSFRQSEEQAEPMSSKSTQKELQLAQEQNAATATTDGETSPSPSTSNALQQELKKHLVSLMLSDAADPSVPFSDIITKVLKLAASNPEQAPIEEGAAALAKEFRSLSMGRTETTAQLDQSSNPGEKSAEALTEWKAWLEKAVCWALQSIKSIDTPRSPGTELQTKAVRLKVPGIRNEMPDVALDSTETFDQQRSMALDGIRTADAAAGTARTGSEGSTATREQNNAQRINVKGEAEQGENLSNRSVPDARKDSGNFEVSGGSPPAIAKMNSMEEERAATKTSRLFRRLQAVVSREQSVHTDIISETTELSALTELEQTPEPPNLGGLARDPAKVPPGPTKLKLYMPSTRHGSKAIDNEKLSTSAISTQGRGSGSKPLGQITSFTLKEYLLIALYIEPRRINGSGAELPKMTSRSIMEFVLQVFPAYMTLANPNQRHTLYNNIAAQCSTHCSRGLLAKSSAVDPETQKLHMVYYVDTTAPKFLNLPGLKELEDRYLKHLAQSRPEMLQEEESLSSRKRRFVDGEIRETPSPKKQKLGSPSVPSNLRGPAGPKLPSEEARRKTRVLKTARKVAHPSRLFSGEPATTGLGPQLSDLGMGISNFRSEGSWISETRTRDSSSSDPVIADSTVEQSPIPEYARDSDRDEPRPNDYDPLDDLLNNSKKPTPEEQELLDLLPQLCAQEAASDPMMMAQKNFQVKDFFAQWPEHHPSQCLLFDRDKKIEEIKKRPNRREMLGKPYRPPNASYRYRPYEDVDSPPQSESESAPSEALYPQTTSPKKQVPRKAEAGRRARAGREDSIIYADDVAVALAQPGTELKLEKKVGSWQEALGLPQELVPGFMTDFGARKGKKLVLEVPLAMRGRSRNWFKAVFPDD